MPDHVHERHHGRAQRASSTASATCPDSACRPSTGSTPAPASWSGARPPVAGRSRRATRSSRRGSQGAAALLHDARFDLRQRLEILARERVNVLCMAPTEYRVIAKRATIPPLPALRTLVAAGEALNPEVLRAFQEVTGRRHPRRLRTDRDRGADRAVRRSARPPGLDGSPAPRRRPDHRGRRAGAQRPHHRPDLLRLLSRRRAGAGRSALADRRPRRAGRGRLPVLRRRAPTT